MDIMEKIQRNAELVREQMGPISGLAFDYDAESVRWVDGYINRQYERGLDDALLSTMESVLGSYLGECIRRNYGGAWHEDVYGWHIRFNAENGVYPFSKVRKQLDAGPEESIYSFFTMIPIVFGAGSPMLEGKASTLSVPPKKL